MTLGITQILWRSYAPLLLEGRYYFCLASLSSQLIIKVGFWKQEEVTKVSSWLIWMPGKPPLHQQSTGERWQMDIARHVHCVLLAVGMVLLALRHQRVPLFLSAGWVPVTTRTLGLCVFFSGLAPLPLGDQWYLFLNCPKGPAMEYFAAWYSFSRIKPVLFKNNHWFWEQGC